MRTKICGIYLITNINGSRYVGQSKDVASRLEGHKKFLGEGSPRLNNSFKSHGIENHIFEIIEECPQELLNEREIYWIKYYDSCGTTHGMNLQSGGHNGNQSEETKKKISITMKGVPKSKEHNRNSGEAQKGKIQTDEHNRNIGKAKIGNTNASGKRTEEQNRKNSEAQKKRKPTTKETKYKMSVSALKRKPFTEEHKKNMKKPKSQESIAKRIKTMKEKKELKQHKIQSIVFRQHYLNTIFNVQQ